MKKWLCILFSILMILGMLSGCGKGEEETQKDTTGKGSQTGSQQEDQTAQEQEVEEGYAKIWLVQRVESVVPEEEVFETLYEYDSEGNLKTEMQFCAGEVEVSYEYTYKYDDTSENVKITRSEAGEKTDWDTYVYAVNGKLTETAYYYDNQEGRKYVYSYDENGNLTECVNYQYGEEYYRVTYSNTYDSNGGLLEEIIYQDGEEASKTTCSYDAAGNLLEEVCFENGSEEFRNIYTYDTDNNLIEKANYNMGGEELAKITYAYNGDGRLEREVYYYGGEERARLDYTYDSNGNLIKMTVHEDYEGGMVQIEYVEVIVAEERIPLLEALNEERLEEAMSMF